LITGLHSGEQICCLANSKAVAQSPALKVSNA